MGVPLIVPVDGSKDRPFGRVGETDQESTAPANEFGEIGDIGNPVSKINEAYEYENAGGTSLTWIVTFAVVLPPELDAVTV